MKNKRFQLFIAALALCSTAVAAQGYDDGAIYEVGTIEVVRTTPELKALLDQARPVEPNAVPTPKFAIRTRDNKFVLSIGGKVNPILGYDIGNDLYHSVNGVDFVTGDIPVPAQPGKKGAFFINPLNAFVDFTAVGLGGTDNQVTAYVKLGLNGSNHTALFKRAYVTWRGIIAGETATLMQDGRAAQPPTIDPQGPCGDVAGTAYQVAYKSPSYSGFSFALGLEMPTFYSSNGYYRGKDYRHDYYDVKVTDEASQLLPDIPAWIQFQASESNRIRLTGILRNFRYRDLVADRTRCLMGGRAPCFPGISASGSRWRSISRESTAKESPITYRTSPGVRCRSPLRMMPPAT